MRPPAGGRAVGAVAVRSLRWALGSSPSWHLALVRAGAPVPDGLFRQALPPEAIAPVADGGAAERQADPGATDSMARRS